MNQLNTRKITGKLVVVTGLHIGCDNSKIEIGGMDNPIIRNPLTQEPYIPGSSIKGKMRSLIEWQLGKISADGDPCSCGLPDCPVCRVFGCANKNKSKNTNIEKDSSEKKRGPTRIIVRDAVLSEHDRERFKMGEPIVEEKSENSLDRITADANPRPIERVVPGVSFDFEIVYRVFDMNDAGKTDKENFEKIVLRGLKLLENDYLGGGGSRGNGQIRFEDLKDEDGKDLVLE